MKHQILHPTSLLNPRTEVTIAKPTDSFLRELYPVFKRDTSRFNIVILILKMDNDLLDSTGNQQIERDDKLDLLMALGKHMRQSMSDKGYFLDYMDPTSGLAMNSNTNVVYADITGCERILQMDVSTTGCCKLVSHSKWGTNIYPFTLFTTAPANIILEHLKLVNLSEDKVLK